MRSLTRSVDGGAQLEASPSSMVLHGYPDAPVVALQSGVLFQSLHDGFDRIWMALEQLFWIDVGWRHCLVSGSPSGMKHEHTGSRTELVNRLVYDIHGGPDGDHIDKATVVDQRKARRWIAAGDKPDEVKVDVE